ncbi:NAD dependent epimerase/dehydratase family protein-like protein [Phaeosphaeriaceae sp. PMI808]|nr:NAD dependent epimerase/dehydratase family protein-like protein [Phaeosphaeriaceae sp. PMI808]
MSVATIVGSTGHGSSILATILAHPFFSSVYAYSRRDLPNPTASTKLNPITSTDTSQWASAFPRESTPCILFSGLATTRADAGSLQGQRKVDYDLNLEIAQAAKEAGVETYVLISSHGASSTSMFPYLKMKGELEDAIGDLNFKYTVFVRPGFIAGERSSRDAGVAEIALKWMAKGLGGLSPALKNPWAQDGDLIAKAAVNAGLQCVQGKREASVWEVGQADIVRLGQDRVVNEQ